ncbi:hypothetical protein AMATHDRAFT_67725, partial [Amanita thiersii Skay4041]
MGKPTSNLSEFQGVPTLSQSSSTRRNSQPQTITVSASKHFLEKFLFNQPAEDVISIVTGYGHDCPIGMITFHHPYLPMYQLVILALSVHLLAMEYNVFTKNCYWFVKAINEYFKTSYPQDLCNISSNTLAQDKRDAPGSRLVVAGRLFGIPGPQVFYPYSRVGPVYEAQRSEFDPDTQR